MYKPKYPKVKQLSSAVTAQAIFDRVALHMLTQNRRSEGEHACLFRSVDAEGNELACPVGIWIPESVYHKGLEIDNLNTAIARIKSRDVRRFFTKHETLFLHLQVIHDTALPKDWRVALKRYAENHGLLFSFIEL